MVITVKGTIELIVFITIITSDSGIILTVGELVRIIVDIGAKLDDAVVIGGESIYRLLLPYCDTAIITKFDAEFTSDASIPNLDNDPEWQLCEVGEDRFSVEGDTLVGMKYNFCTYRR